MLAVLVVDRVALRERPDAALAYTFAEQTRELDAVVSRLRLGAVVPIAHDGSGPAGINWSLAHRDQVAALVLLNTFYGVMPTTNAPQAIRIFSQPEFAPLASAIAADRAQTRWLFFWQVGRFMSDPTTRATVLHRLWPNHLRRSRSLPDDLAVTCLDRLPQRYLEGCTAVGAMAAHAHRDDPASIAFAHLEGLCVEVGEDGEQSTPPFSDT
jgi:pimeloyl-ACP methyl ester carboxylesterase